MTNKFQKREIFAYQFLKDKNYLKTSKNRTLEELEKKLNSLPNSNFFFEFKVRSVLKLKWYFDYLNNYLEDPSKIKKIVNEIYFETILYENFYLSNWIIKNEPNKKNQNKWSLTRESFDYMWTKTTDDKWKFNISKKIIEPRLKQIISYLPKNFLKNKKIIDSGCGPARYIDIIKKYKPKLIYGVDTGKEIIKANLKKFKKNNNIFFKTCDFSKLPFKNEFFDFIISAGVLHHSETSIENLMKEHARILKRNGYMFVFIKSTGGMELKLWKFYRSIFKNIPIQWTKMYLENKIHPLRIQGFLDHCYGTYKETSRARFEKILNKHFSNFRRVKGVEGIDVTPEIYFKDKFFSKRFGEGDLRYLLKK